MLQIVEQSHEEKLEMYMKLSKKQIAEMLIESNNQLDAILGVKKIPHRYKCLLCGRDTFTQKSPHCCVGGYRKHHIKWQIIT